MANNKPASPKAPAATAVAPAPTASATKQIPVVVKCVGAKEVILTGDFTQWATDRIRMTAGTNGEWRATLSLKPGEYQYRLRIDGEWRDDPGCPRRVGNAFGTQNNVLVVG